MAICATCGQETVAEFRFCPECGAPAEHAASDGVRKTVSVVFCDLVGSTALGESTDPEAVRALLGRYFARMRSIVERHGGTVEKFIGDAVVAVFGVPNVHEDDALRACRAAVEMRDALPELGIRGRIGVNTGEVMTSTADVLAAGDTMNVAARLEQAAPPGEVLIGEQTRATVRDAVEAEAVEPLALKGKAEPVVAYRLVSVLPVPERSHSLPFVGREAELERIAAAWSCANGEARCELVTVVADAGVGKSRLVAEALAHVTGRVVRGRCLPYGDGITYWPVVEVLKQLAALPTDPAAGVAINSLLGSSAVASSANEIAWAFRKLLGEQAPLVVVFDDLQWGEETFLDLVESTALLATGAPLLLLCMARPELLQRRPGWPGVLLLEPLGREQADALIGEDVSPDLRTRIADAAGGNPLFISEMVAMASERGEVDVPPTLKALLAMRLDQLDKAERTILERGSIEGEIFHRGAVQALAPEEPQVDTRLAALVRHQLVRPGRAQLAGEDGYRFRHLLVRDAAYDGLAKAVRAELHQRFAVWLEIHGQELVELEEIVGYHLEQAARYLSELGRPELGLAEHAARKLAAGGMRARWRGDRDAARSLLGRAFELTGRSDLHLGIAYAMSERNPSESTRLLEEIAEDADARADTAGAALARTIAAGAAGWSGDQGAPDEQERLARTAVPLLEAREDHIGLAELWVSLANGVYNYRGRGEQMVQAAERAREHETRAGLPHRSDHLLAMGLVYGPTPVEDALRRLEALEPEPALEADRAVLLAMNDQIEKARTITAMIDQRARELGSTADAWRAEIESLAGNHESAATLFGSWCDFLAGLGQRGPLAQYTGLQARELCLLGRYADAEPVAARAYDLDRGDPIAQQAAALVKAHQGAHVDAERLVQQALGRIEAHDSPKEQGDCLTDLAQVLHAGGRHAEAAAALRQALELYERKGVIPLARRTREQLAALGDDAEKAAARSAPT